MTRKLNLEDMKRAVRQTNALVHKEEKDQADSVMQVVLKENGDVFEIVKEDKSMCQALRKLMTKEIQEKVQKEVQKELQKELQKQLCQLVQKNIIHIETAAAEANLSVEEFTKKMIEWKI